MKNDRERQRRHVLAAGLVLSALASGLACGACPGQHAETLAGNAVSAGEEDVNLRLYVSNQSAAVNPVDIEVRIDGRIVISADFGDTAVPATQPAWQPFGFELEQGRHLLVATSSKGDARLEAEFELDGPRWAALAYWPRRAADTQGLGQFTLNISERPIAFY